MAAAMNGTGGMDVAAIMQRLTNPQDFDISLLDQLVAATFDSKSPQRAAANKALMQLQNVDGMWQKADAIMENTQNPATRFFGLQILDDAIKTRYERTRASCWLHWSVSYNFFAHSVYT